MTPHFILAKEKTLPEITNQILDSCTKLQKIQHLGHCPLPTYNTVTEILDDLFELIYPGYGKRNNLHAGNITYYIGEVLNQLFDKLSVQISRSLCQNHLKSACVEAECNPRVQQEFDIKAQKITLEFLARIPQLREILQTDVEAAYVGDPACRSDTEVVFCYPGLKAITVYRIAHELHLLNVPLIPRMMTEWAHQLTGIDIHPGAKISHHFFIDHGTGVVIGETCEIGHWVKLYQGVTLGALSFPTDDTGNLVRGLKRHPTLDNHVIIYANATILGGETVIGHHSVIGSSAWIIKSVEPHSTVMTERPNLRIK
ncbi:MAG: serine O-acetyltransferase EpsC [Planctomycetia bacterium]|nr:serine O-acetyltransferase EpsC [Planctomycetia bacterium]